MKPEKKEAYGPVRRGHALGRGINAAIWRWLGEGERFLWLLVGLSAAWRLWWLWRFWRRHPPPPEDFEEGDIARNILAGRGYSAGADWLTPFGQPTAHKPPIFTMILVASYWVFPESRFPVTVLNSALLVVANALLYVLARRLIDERTARTAALVFLASPVTAHTGLSVTNTALAITTVLWALYEAARYLEEGGRISAARTGSALAVMVHAIPAALTLAPAVVWYAWERERGRRRRAELGVLLAVVLALSLPWALRNWATFRTVIPVVSTLPLEFAIGNGPNANGGLVTAGGGPVLQPPPEQVAHAREAGLDEVSAYRYYGKQALAWSLGNPRGFLVLRLRSLLFFLFPQQFFYYPLDKLAIAKLVFTLAVVPTAAVGAVLAWRRYGRARLVVVSLLCFGALYAVTHGNVSPRYREPVDPLIALLASMAAVRAFDVIARRVDSFHGIRRMSKPPEERQA